MNRRKFLNGFGKFAALTPPVVSSKMLIARTLIPVVDERRFLLLYSSVKENSYEIAQSIKNRVLGDVGNVFSASRFNVTYFDVSQDSERFSSFKEKYARNTENLELPVLVHIPFPDSEEVEFWDERWQKWASKDIHDACYPISDGWWSVEGDWNPTTEKVRKHLFLSPNHTEGAFAGEYLDRLQFEELQSLHSDHHREMTGRGQVRWNYVNTECLEN